MFSQRLHFVAALLVFALMSTSCARKENAYSFQTSTTSRAEAISNQGSDSQASQQNDVNLFDGFSAGSSQPSPQTTQLKPTQKTNKPENPDISPAAPKQSPTTTSAPIKKSTIVTASSKEAFTNTSSSIRKIAAYNDPIITVSINASCESGKEYILEAKVYEDNKLLLVYDSESTCITNSVASYRNTPFKYASTSKYSVTYKLYHDGYVLAETSTTPAINL